MNNYIKFFKSKWILLVILIFGILVGFAISKQGVTARPQEDGTLVLSVEDETSGVLYVIGVDNLNNEVNGMIEYDQNSAPGIEKYRAFNNQELANILQNADAMDNIPVKVTFNTPLNQAEFAELVKQYGIDVKKYIIYMLEPDGKIATIQGSPSDTELVPAEFFNTATTSISQEYNTGAEFIGWVEVDGTVQANRIPDIKADRRIFLVDIMPVFLESKLTDKVLAEAGIAKDVRQELLQFGFTEIHQAPLAWSLYHLGLMQTNPQ
jgi:hypothetical protein